MADRFGEFLAELENPALYLKVQDVPVFDAHQEVYFVDPRTRKMVPPKSPGAKKVVKDFDRKALEAIAQKCNHRDSTGSLSPITLGHTNPEEPDETRQPEAVGYARGYKVRWDERLKKWVLATNYYIRQDRAAEAKTYPRTSVELWPSDEIIDPISLLRRTPQRDLGQWTYSKSQFHRAAGAAAWRYSRAGRPVLRYTMETKPMAEPWEDDPAEAGGDGADETGGGGMPSPEEHEQFMRHVLSHPTAQKYARCYAMQDEPPMPEGAAADLPDPTAAPAAEAPLQNRKRGGVSQYLKGGRTDADRARAAEEAAADAHAKNWVLTLRDIEGIDLDDVREVDQFARAWKHSGDEGCLRYAAHIRRHYKERIDHPRGAVAASRAPIAAAGSAGRRGKVETIDDLDAAQAQKVKQYSREKKVSFEDAFEAMFHSAVNGTSR